MDYDCRMRMKVMMQSSLKITCSQSSLSSPDRHARRRNAKAKESAARAPTRARPSAARFTEEEGRAVEEVTVAFGTTSAGFLEKDNAMYMRESAHTD